MRERKLGRNLTGHRIPVFCRQSPDFGRRTFSGHRILVVELFPVTGRQKNILQHRKTKKIEEEGNSQPKQKLMTPH